MSSKSVLVGIGGLIALLAVVAIVLAVQPAETFDPSTPEGAAQQYYQAVLAGDNERALSSMTEVLRDACDERISFYDRGADARIVVTKSSVENDSAILDVTIEIFYGDGPFGGGSYDQDERIVLERADGRWLIAEPAWPMDDFRCAPVGDP
jgi:hypothetical protein